MGMYPFSSSGRPNISSNSLPHSNVLPRVPRTYAPYLVVKRSPSPRLFTSTLHIVVFLLHEAKQKVSCACSNDRSSLTAAQEP